MSSELTTVKKIIFYPNGAPDLFVENVERLTVPRDTDLAGVRVIAGDSLVTERYQDGSKPQLSSNRDEMGPGGVVQNTTGSGTSFSFQPAAQVWHNPKKFRFDPPARRAVVPLNTASSNLRGVVFLDRLTDNDLTIGMWRPAVSLRADMFVDMPGMNVEAEEAFISFAQERRGAEVYFRASMLKGESSAMTRESGSDDGPKEVAPRFVMNQTSFGGRMTIPLISEVLAQADMCLSVNLAQAYSETPNLDVLFTLNQDVVIPHTRFDFCVDDEILSQSSEPVRWLGGKAVVRFTGFPGVRLTVRRERLSYDQQSGKAKMKVWVTVTNFTNVQIPVIFYLPLQGIEEEGVQMPSGLTRKMTNAPTPEPALYDLWVPKGGKFIMHGTLIKTSYSLDATFIQ